MKPPPRAALPTTDDHGRRVIAVIDAFVRRTGWGHSKLAERAGVEPARVTMLLSGDWPTDWIDIAGRLENVLADEADRERREAMMPVMTPTVKRTLGLVKLMIEDGGIGLIQGDSGVGKTEATWAVSVRYPKAITTLATVCRCRPKPMLEDIAARMHVNAWGKSLEDVYQRVVDELPRRCELIVIDEAHRYIGKPDCIHTLADLLKETGVPQLWTATGDLMRYLGRQGSSRDPFAQVRSRITHRVDLNALRERGGELAGRQDVAEIARRNFGLKLDAASGIALAAIAGEADGGGLRRVDTILKDARRHAAAGMPTADAIHRAIDRTAGTRPVRRGLPVKRGAASGYGGDASNGGQTCYGMNGKTSPTPPHAWA